ncbi:MAG TPA: hypothetical protein VGF28_24965 [Thermoanaerobaculia bacterium]
MKKRLLAIVLAAGGAFAQDTADRVALDAAVVDRVAEASKRDLPRDLLRRIVEEDLELLRGRRTDGSYEYATYERFESGRITKSFSVQPRGDKMETIELRGANVYRVLVDIPSRRLLVRRNRAVWIERVDVDYIAQGTTQNRQQSFEVKSWLQPGEARPIDLPAIARQVTAKVIATADKEGGYGNLDVALVQARIVDLATSPYAEAVTSAKALLRALENGEVPAVRSNAQRMREALAGAEGFSPPAEIAAVRAAAPQGDDGASRLELQTELQMIEDLLTGSETERREGLDRLHQLIRRMRQ